MVRRLELRDVMDLYALREIIEGAAARLAAEHAPAAEIEAIGDLAGALDRSADDVREAMRLDRLFHKALCRASGNRYFDPILSDMLDIVATLGANMFVVQQRRLDAAREHRGIAEAIAARDGAAAESLAREHVRKALRARLRYLQKN